MIYFVQEEDGNEQYIKIGWAQDPEGTRYGVKCLEDRICKLQVGNARYLKILAVIKGTGKRDFGRFSDEAMVHEKFWDIRVPTKGRGERYTERGEWFCSKQELMDLIASLPRYPALDGLTDERGDELLRDIRSLPRVTREEDTAERCRQMYRDAAAIQARPIR
jgi:hypothetical protein